VLIVRLGAPKLRSNLEWAAALVLFTFELCYLCYVPNLSTLRIECMNRVYSSYKKRRDNLFSILCACSITRNSSLHLLNLSSNSVSMYFPLQPPLPLLSPFPPNTTWCFHVFPTYSFSFHAIPSFVVPSQVPGSVSSGLGRIRGTLAQICDIVLNFHVRLRKSFEDSILQKVTFNSLVPNIVIIN